MFLNVNSILRAALRKHQRTMLVHRVPTFAVVLALSMAWTAFPGRALSQTPEANRLPNKSYMNKNIFYLPIHIAPGKQLELSEVQLFIKTRQEDPWTIYAKASPDQKEFVFQGVKDGEYWFTLVTIDRNGRPSTGDISKQGPGAIVVLDRKAPAVQLKRLGKSEEGDNIFCQVTDEHPDPAQTRVEYQTRGLDWLAMTPVPGKANVFLVPQQAAISGLVRVSAMDRANNVTRREFHLQDIGRKDDLAFKKVDTELTLPGQTDNRYPVKPVTNEKVVQTPYVPANSIPEPIEQTKLVINKNQEPKSFPKLENALPVEPQQTQTVSKKIAPKTPRKRNGVELICDPRLVLNYRVEDLGQSGLGRVDIWVTSDKGQTWKKIGTDTDQKSPAEANLPGEGIYGITLVATNGRGFGGEPPKKGFEGDWIVELDTTAPVAKILKIEPYQGGRPGVMLVSWEAKDKNFSENCINLEFATNPNGPWHVIGQGLRNTGYYPWLVPAGFAGNCYVRLTAEDDAGHSTTVVSEELQIDDQSRPRIRLMSIGNEPAPRIVPGSIGN